LINKKILCVAGEPSGDLLASDVIAQIKNNPNLIGYECYGIGGPRMDAAGFKSIWSIDRLSVRGYIEAIKQLPEILKIRRELIKEIDKTPPSVYVGIDAPDFNLGVERHCRNLGIPTVHFISPSIWAWRGGRIKGIKKSVDHMLCIFPFETEIYGKAGVKSTYIGHPLASSIPMDPNVESAKAKLDQLGCLKLGPITKDELLIAVLPGSRQSEINLIAPGFFKAIGKIHSKVNRQLRFLIPIAVPKLRDALRKLEIQLLKYDPNIKIELIDGQSSLILEACDVVLIASGTATLEAALWKKPMVISYTVPWLTGQIMKRQGYLPYVGLPNILCNEFVVPELLQKDATPDNLANAILDWVNNPMKVRSLIQRFNELHIQLKRPTAILAVQAIESTMNKQ
jgi:lipid-A-disaccharide synthase